MTRRVDFFIIGAPKCGTTALAQNLEQNSAIVFSKPKEPHYFSVDLDDGYEKPATDEAYHDKFFPPKKTKGEVWGEGSVWTMYSEEGVARIRDYNPNAKVIVLIRDPAQAAFSLHQQMIFQQEEDIKSFAEAWKRSDARFSRKDFPSCLTLDPKLVAYRHAYTYMPQLRRVFATFPEDHVLLMTQAEYMRDGVAALTRINSFIGAEAFQSTASKKINESLYMKDGPLMEVLRSKAVVRLASKTKKLLGLRTFGIGRPAGRISLEEIAMVHADLADDIAAVQQNFGIDLVGSKAAVPDWLNAPPSQGAGDGK